MSYIDTLCSLGALETARRCLANSTKISPTEVVMTVRPPSAAGGAGIGSRKRLSNSPAPLSNVSLSNETDNSNDDDDMYRYMLYLEKQYTIYVHRSDSGGGSGESAEMMRVAQQLLRPRDGEQADSASVNEAAPVAGSLHVLLIKSI